MDFLALILCAYLVSVLVQALRFLKEKASTSPSNLPPGPPPLPVIGNLLELGDLPHKSLTKLARTYGPILKLQLGYITTIVISSPIVAKEILQVHDTSFSNRMVPSTLTAFKQDELGLPWAPISPLWRNLRRVCNLHIFTHRKLDSTQHLRLKKVQELLAHVKISTQVGNAVDIGEAAFRTSLNFLFNTIFSLDLADPSPVSATELRKIVSRIMVEAGKPNIADYFPVPRKIDPQGSRRRMKLYFGQMLDLFEGLIQKRLQMRAASDYARKDDVLDTLIDICEDKNEDMEIFQIKHLFLDLFTAGTDTTSSTLEWAMAELLHSPEKLSRAQAELDQVIGKGNLVDELDVTRLPYLQAIVKETFRLHPPAPLLLPRKSAADLEISGLTIPKGAQVFVNVWAIGRDGALWEDPNAFIPERFLGSEMDVKGQSFELIPFGGGRRICPGLPLAMRMVHMMLGSLLNCFYWKHEVGIQPEDMNMDDKFGLTLQKDQPLRAVRTLV
ncbi:geraniol 8-hydroxylase-like [Syzygium oleosum]|uniref:geraniol 8-hydroxylase-like n=1 Tax=Syzygium oleosum TaxID=219896 RepID=UPI0024BB438E|nr:geraniol 8-hydroxylase-like [Syzygium oleosum]